MLGSFSPLYIEAKRQLPPSGCGEDGGRGEECVAGET